MPSHSFWFASLNSKEQQPPSHIQARRSIHLNVGLPWVFYPPIVNVSQDWFLFLCIFILRLKRLGCNGTLPYASQEMDPLFISNSFVSSTKNVWFPCRRGVFPEVWKYDLNWNPNCFRWKYYLFTGQSTTLSSIVNHFTGSWMKRGEASPLKQCHILNSILNS